VGKEEERIVLIEVIKNERLLGEYVTVWIYIGRFEDEP
jgi:hypothetical protein